MQKKQVSRRLNLILNSIFYSICLFGLIWQITNISSNFFQYSVVSSIKILMPGVERGKFLTVCFNGWDIIDRLEFEKIVKDQKYKPLGKKSMSPRQGGYVKKINFTYPSRRPFILKIMNGTGSTGSSPALPLCMPPPPPPPPPPPSPTPSATGGQSPASLYRQRYEKLSVTNKFKVVRHFLLIFHNKEVLKIERYFILGNLVCYSFSSEKKEMEVWKPNKLVTEDAATIFQTNVASGIVKKEQPFLVLLSEYGKAPTNEFSIAIPNVHGPEIYYVSSYFYDLNRLSAPYSDNCFNYSKIHAIDRYDAINGCVQESLTKQNVSYAMKMFFRGNPFPFGRTKEYENYYQCLSKLSNLDCHLEIHFTEVKFLPGQVTLTPINQVFSTQPSYRIESQAKIEDIDFVTYIFGAMGTWFGFSFLMMNPFSYFITSKVKPSSDDECIKSGQQLMKKFRSLDRHNLRVHSHLIEVDKIISEHVKRFSNHDGLFYSLSSDINRKFDLLMQKIEESHK